MESGWFVVIGAAIGVIPALIVGWLNQRAEKEKHLRQMVLEISIAEHKRIFETAQINGKGIIPPVYAHIPIAYKVVFNFMSGNLKAEDMDPFYSELAKMSAENEQSIVKHMGFNK